MSRLGLQPDTHPTSGIDFDAAFDAAGDVCAEVRVDSCHDSRHDGMADSTASTRSGDAVDTRPCNAFTVDVEDYFHVQAFAGVVDRREWEHYESRVVASTHRILRLLAEHGVQGTFFVLGWVAEKYPALVRDIVRDGHEIGCHSYWHRLVYDLSPEEFREDLRQGRDVLEDLVGGPVTAYRAPCFSITERSRWALDILVEEGFDMDSSLFPTFHDTYGTRDCPRFPHRIACAGGSLREFPATIHEVLRYPLPVAGGGYFRLYPVGLSLRWLRGINERLGRPFVFYVHPWEVDPEQPRLRAPWRSRFRHYLNLHSTYSKLERLVRDFRLGTLSRAWAATEANPSG